MEWWSKGVMECVGIGDAGVLECREAEGSEGVLESWGGQSALLRRAGGWRSKVGPGSERRWEKVGREVG